MVLSKENKMLWLEMTRNPILGGGEWSLTKSLWSPKYKKAGETEGRETWGFWETLLAVKSGDQVLHLTGKGVAAAIIGCSTAVGDGHEIKSKPPRGGDWGYASILYRVVLRDFVSFENPIMLHELFSTREKMLREYFIANREKERDQKKRVFFVIQGGRLQCQNGAYLSEVDDRLAEIILDQDTLPDSVAASLQHTPSSVRTSEVIAALKVRVGQTKFSRAVRDNFNSKCCMPDCPIDDDVFLVGAHIARWADNPLMRGSIRNGLCLCLNHDRAFERGYFGINSNMEVMLNFSIIKNESWAMDFLKSASGKAISSGILSPSVEAFSEHRSRIGL